MSLDVSGSFQRPHTPKLALQCLPWAPGILELWSVSEDQYKKDTFSYFCCFQDWKEPNLEPWVFMSTLTWGQMVRQEQGSIIFAFWPSNLSKWASMIQKIKCNDVIASCHTSSALTTFISWNSSNNSVLNVQILQKKKKSRSSWHSL